MQNPKLEQFLTTTRRHLDGAYDLASLTFAIRTAARMINGADGATVVLREGDFCFYIDESAISPLWKGKRFPMESCVSGWTFVNRSTVAIENVFLDARVPADAYRPTFVKSLLMVPIGVDSPLGAIGNYWAVRHRPTVEESRQLERLAELVYAPLRRLR